MINATRYTALLFFLGLAGCTVPPPEPPPSIDPPPVCYSKPQCDAMWAEAIGQLQSISGMRLQIATETVIQTFNATGYGRLTGMARKVPKPDGSTVIESAFTCNFCGVSPYKAVNMFSWSVSYAGHGFEEPAAESAAPTPKTPAITVDDYKKAFPTPQGK